jgi:SAM-dependent methyltransferase
MRDTDSDWREVARKEPYWGVISVDRYKGKALKEQDEKVFFQSGPVYVEAVLALTRMLLDPKFEIRRALDFGCGVGRLAIAIAKVAKGEVVGVDISPEMLRLCAGHAKEAGVTNLTLVESDDDLSRVEGQFNFINTYIVLQHIPPDRGIALIRKLLSLAENNGVVALQFTYAKARRLLKHEEGRSAYFRREGGVVYELSPRPDLRPEGSITMYDYDLNQVMAVIQEATKYPMVVKPTDDDGHIGVQIVLKVVR